ncbi:MAG: ABC transporter ATP-binding protein [Deltaproteobacteria bacterium]|nr:ABC transporter ATP-binding protein [Deltaproteobacteria bacterium]
MNAIEVQGLTKRFGDLVAVDHIDFSVTEGETYGFLGPNGAGKTTTIRMLVGLARPSEGKGRVQGYDIERDQSKVKQSIGVVPDVSNLYGELSARDNLIFLSRLYGVPRKERKQRADDLLREFGLFERRDDPFRKFSRGIKRRLTIAAALVHRPRILFMDEPTTGLDVAAARGLRQAIKQLHARGVTIFLTTHYIEEADQLCHRVAIIVKGKIIVTDTPEALKRRTQADEILELRVQKEDDGLRQKLAGIPGVLQVSVENCLVKLYISSLNDVLPGVVSVLQQNRSMVGSIRTVLPSLEDAFVRITGLEAEKLRSEQKEANS